MTVLDQLNTVVASAFDELGFPVNFAKVMVSDRPDLAPFQCNAAMAVAGFFKKQGEKKNPREIAAAIIAKIEGDDAIETLEIAGAGVYQYTPIESDYYASGAAAKLRSECRN